jgi:hypothetical protein
MSVRPHFNYVFCCADGGALRWFDPISKESYQMPKGLRLQKLILN